MYIEGFKVYVRTHMHVNIVYVYVCMYVRTYISMYVCILWVHHNALICEHTLTLSQAPAAAVGEKQHVNSKRIDHVRTFQDMYILTNLVRLVLIV